MSPLVVVLLFLVVVQLLRLLPFKCDRDESRPHFLQKSDALTSLPRTRRASGLCFRHRTTQALHPTNLHVNKALFPNDTVQSRLPEPGWLERWLDEQIQFDAVWEGKVVDRILHNLSLLFERSFKTAQDLNRYRRELTRAEPAPT